MLKSLGNSGLYRGDVRGCEIVKPLVLRNVRRFWLGPVDLFGRSQYFSTADISNAMSSFLDPLLRSKEASFVLMNDRNQRMVARTLLTAFDSSSRRRGLLQHDSLPDDTALIIAPTNAIHTFFMRFAIDVAFVARSGEVLKLRRDMPSWRIAAAWRGFAVVELASGALDRADTRPGDRLRVTLV